ncbi:MAG: signal peptide peptidase SppA [Balneolaceae bacterium]
MNFIKTFLASVLGTVIGLFLLLFILFVSLVSTSGETEPHIRSNTVLTLELSGGIPARLADDPFRDLIETTPGDRLSLELLKNNLEKAAADDRITGIWLKVNRISESWGNLETAYHYLNEFREQSGKFIYASTDDLGMNENAYFLASTADSIFSPPQTYFEFNGFVVQTSYYKDMLDRIGIEPEIMRVGSYKSAVEPFIREDSSPEHREQMMSILNSTSGTFVSAVEDRRNTPAGRINELMEEIPENSVEWALEAGLIDAIAHPHEVEATLRNRLGLDDDADIRTVSLNRYNRVESGSAGLEESGGGNRIAVIYASGIIIPEPVGGPFSNDPVITASNIRESLEASLDDDDVKAIVLHIDSGGGAVSTSELIWGHIREAAEKKPLIAYMGNVAASGGYYIAMGADTVMASPNTITGSIGIYNLMFNSRELFNDKLGIDFSEFKTHEHADMALMNRPLSESERRALQRSVENGYETFLDRVAAGRDMTRDEVHEVARGRVWTGTQAREVNLIDLLGTLDDAIAVAAEKADIEEYGIVTYPERKNIMDMLFRSTGARVSGWIRSLVPYPDDILTVEQLMKHNAGKNWALLPVNYTID